MRNQEKKHFALKEYDKAEKFKTKADALEQDEREILENQINEKIEKEEAKLR